MPELTPEYRAQLRQDAEHYGDPVIIVQLLDALDAAELRTYDENLNASAALARVARLEAEVNYRDQALELFVPAQHYAASQKAIVDLRERASAKEADCETGRWGSWLYAPDGVVYRGLAFPESGQRWKNVNGRRVTRHIEQSPDWSPSTMSDREMNRYAPFVEAGDK